MKNHENDETQSEITYDTENNTIFEQETALASESEIEMEVADGQKIQ